MHKVFRDIINELFEDDILEYIKKDISMNYEDYDLYIRKRFIGNMQGVTVNNIKLLSICGIKQFHDKVMFELMVDCDLEVCGFTYDEEVYENMHQWFKLSCISTLRSAELEGLNILKVQAFNKNRMVKEWT